MKHNTRGRLLFWVVFLSAVASFLIFGIYPQQRILGRARKAADIVQHLISADPRFDGVHVGWATNGSVDVVGKVRSTSDLDALKRLVEDTNSSWNPTKKPIIEVDVPTDSQ